MIFRYININGYGTENMVLNQVHIKNHYGKPSQGAGLSEVNQNQQAFTHAPLYKPLEA